MFIKLITNDVQNIIGNYVTKLNLFFKIVLIICALFLLMISFVIGFGVAFIILSDTQLYTVIVIQKIFLIFFGSDLLRKFIFSNFSFKAYQYYLLLPIKTNALFGFLSLRMAFGLMEILYYTASFTFSLYLFNWSFSSFLFVFMFFLVLNINSVIVMTLKYIFSYNAYSLDYFLYLITIICISLILIFTFSTIQKTSNLLTPSIILLMSWLVILIYTKKMMLKVMRD